jgi:hypothetical protein
MTPTVFTYILGHPLGSHDFLLHSLLESQDSPVYSSLGTPYNNFLEDATAFKGIVFETMEGGLF